MARYCDSAEGWDVSLIDWLFFGPKVVEEKGTIMNQLSTAENWEKVAEVLREYGDESNFVEGNDWVWTGGDDPKCLARYALPILIELRRDYEGLRKALKSLLEIHSECYCNDPEDPLLDSRIRCRNCQIKAALGEKG